VKKVEEQNYNLHLLNSKVKQLLNEVSNQKGVIFDFQEAHKVN